MNKVPRLSRTTKTTISRHVWTSHDSAVACNDFMSFEIWSNMASESTSADSKESVFFKF